MKLANKIIIISVIIFILIALFIVVLTDDEVEQSYEDIQRNLSITKNITTYQPTQLTTLTSSLDSSEWITNTSSTSGSFNIVYNELTENEKYFVNDLAEILKLANTIHQTIYPNAPEVPIWLYIGIAMSESSTISIGGIKFPAFLKDLTDISTYSSGDLFSKKGYDTTGSYAGIFQVSTNNLSIGVNTLNTYLASNSISKSLYTSSDGYGVLQQLLTFAYIHTDDKGSSGKYSYMGRYKDQLGLTDDEVWVLSGVSHLWRADDLFPYQSSDSWLPFLKEIMTPSVSNSVSKYYSTYGNKALTSILMYYGADYNLKVGSSNTTQNGDNVTVQTLSSNFSPSSWFEQNISTTIFKDFTQKVGDMSITESSISGSKKFLGNYLAELVDSNGDYIPEKYAYISETAYRNNGGLVFYIGSGEYIGSSERAYFALSLAQIKHFLLPYHYGRYLISAMEVMLDK